MNVECSMTSLAIRTGMTTFRVGKYKKATLDKES